MQQNLNEYNYEATILRVVDGDTIDVELTLADVDLGFSIYIQQKHRVKLRLAGINAPENSTPEGQLATKNLKVILPTGGTCRVITVKDRTEKYGRYLAWVYLPSTPETKDAKVDWICLNDKLIEMGAAEPYNPSNAPHPIWP